jgi:hypothetical protein
MLLPNLESITLSQFMPTKPSIWEFLPQPERDHIPPRERQDRQVWPGYWIYHNRDDSISFGTEQRDYFWLAPSRNHSRRPGVGHQHHRLYGLPRPPHGTEGSARFPEAIRSRADARAGLAALSDERLAEDDSSSATTLNGQVAIAFLTLSVRFFGDLPVVWQYAVEIHEPDFGKRSALCTHPLRDAFIASSCGRNAPPSRINPSASAAFAGSNREASTSSSSTQSTPRTSTSEA